MKYFISKMFDDVIYRYNEKENELELYVDDGKWELKKGIYADYLTGVHSSVWSINEDKALQIIKNINLKLQNSRKIARLLKNF